MVTISGQLDAVAPFDFAHSLRFLGEFTPTQPDHQVGGTSFSKAMLVDGLPVGFKVSGIGSVEQPRLAYTLYSECSLTPEQQAAALDRIRFFFSLDDDLRPFYTIGRADPCFAPVIDQLYGFHQVKFSVTPFENAVWAILTQRNHMSIARKMKDALVARYGSRFAVDGSVHPVFPDPQALAEASEAELVSLIHHQQKAEYLSAAARAFLRVNDNFLRHGDYEEVYDWLRSIKGIGEWSAKFVLIRGLGRTDEISTEGRLLEAAAKHYPQPMTEKSLKVFASRYGIWQGYWAFYLRNS